MAAKRKIVLLAVLLLEIQYFKHKIPVTAHIFSVRITTLRSVV